MTEFASGDDPTLRLIHFPRRPDRLFAPHLLSVAGGGDARIVC
jgi:hypothetical protein